MDYRRRPGLQILSQSGLGKETRPGAAFFYDFGTPTGSADVACDVDMTDFQEQLQAAFDAEKKTVSADCAGQRAGAKAVLAATAKAQSRLDVTLNGVLAHAGAKLDCRQGCDYCCSFKVEVGAEEVFAMKHYATSQLSTEQAQAVAERARDNAKTLAGLSQSRRITTNIPCAFLHEHACLVHAVRPAMCRKLHSTDVRRCQQSYDQPGDATVENAEHPVVAAISMTAIAATREGIKDAGYDATIYDLNEVLADAFDNPKCEKRWGQGKKAFPGCGQEK